jgi:hypothetical protein
MVSLSGKDAAWLCQCLERRQAMQHSKIDANIKVLKQELSDLLEEDAKADKLRSLHLYSCKILTGNLYVPSVMIRSTLVIQEPWSLIQVSSFL